MLELVDMEIRRIDNTKAFLIKGKKESLIIDPTNEQVIGQNKSRIVLFTTKKQLPVAVAERVTIAAGGEYEIGGVEILGINAGERGVVYTVSIDNLTIGVLGELDEVLTDKRVERVGAVDVLLVDLVGKAEAKLVMGWAKKWGANYLLPMGRIDEPEVVKFLDVADQEGITPVDVLKVERDELPEGLEMAILK